MEQIKNMTMQKHWEKIIVHIQFSAFISKRINAEIPNLKKTYRKRIKFELK
jgi:hypothetical protein